MASQSPEHFDVVHARLLRFFPELVEELGGDAGDLLTGAGIDPDAFQDGAPEATYRQTIVLVEQAAQALRCPDFGMRLAVRQGDGILGPLGHVMKNSRTYGGALAYVCGHTQAHSLAARIWQERAPGERGTFFSHEILIEGMLGRSQTIEQLMLLGHLLAMELTGGRARARRIDFRHQPLSPLATYRRYFGCEVRFGQDADGVLHSDADLASPIVKRDRQAYESAIAFIHAHFDSTRPPFHAAVRGAIAHLVWTGEASNARVAADLNLHPRTLHRRLAAEETSFQELKDEVRREVLLYYLT